MVQIYSFIQLFIKQAILLSYTVKLGRGNNQIYIYTCDCQTIYQLVHYELCQYQEHVLRLKIFLKIHFNSSCLEHIF